MVLAPLDRLPISYAQMSFSLSHLVTALIAGCIGGIAGAVLVMSRAPSAGAPSAFLDPAMAVRVPASEPQVISIKSGGQVPSVLKTCDKELHEFCASVAFGKGRLLKCLSKKATSLSSQCLSVVKDMQDQISDD